jgi:hypothetical protein
MLTQPTLPRLAGSVIATTILCLYSKPIYAQVVDLTLTLQLMQQAGQDYLHALQQRSSFASVHYIALQGYQGQIDALALGNPELYCRPARNAHQYADSIAEWTNYSVAPPYSPIKVVVEQQCSYIGQ